jgi:transcriptional regulator with GAF, ATPase, and Fis domain
MAVASSNRVIAASAEGSMALVSGSDIDREPLLQGMRIVLDLVHARNAVVFSIRPQALVFHAALGDESARLASRLTPEAERLHTAVQGPSVLCDARRIVGPLDGPTCGESPAPDVVVLAERRHRDAATAVAMTLRADAGALSATTLRFAHTVFRDFMRHLRTRTSAVHLDARWQASQFAGLVGRSHEMTRLFRSIEKLAASDVNVLILGESGTGKELVARAIHDLGANRGRKFVAQNCAALPEALLESELFGHCKGAFTGANFEKRGLFEEANGGTFFLDEIADMPIPLQIKMLRVLQEGEIRRLGETRTRQVSVRVIAATNKPLANEVAHGRFREDLFFRLNVVKLDLPALRRRREDIPLLARFFCEKVAARVGGTPLEFSEEALGRLVEHEWPGNVRELENEIERIVALHGDAPVVQPYMLSERVRYGSSVDWSLDKLEEIHDLHRATEYLERALIARSLERHSWNKSKAAQELGISRQGLIKKVRRLRLLRSSALPAAGVPHDLLDLQLRLPFVEDDSTNDEGDAAAAALDVAEDGAEVASALRD